MPRQPKPNLQLTPIIDAADFVGVNRRTLERLINRGDLTAYRLGRRCTRVDLNELISLMRGGGGRVA